MKSSILIVEDDAILARLYKYCLEKHGFAVSVAADGEIAIQMLERTVPDLVIADLMLPKVHGIDVIKHIRASPRTAHVPVIVATNAYLASMVKAARAAGANQCLTKAECSPEDLVKVIKETLDPSHQQPGAPSPAAPGTEATPQPQPAPQSAPAKPAPEVQAPDPSPNPPPSPIPPRTVPVSGEESSATPLQPPVSLLDAFRETLPDLAMELRAYTAAVDRYQVESHLLPKLTLLQKHAEHLEAYAEQNQQHGIRSFAKALGQFLAEAQDEPENVSPSALRTLVQTVEFVPILVQRTQDASLQASMAPLILVVDDEVICRQMVQGAMKAVQVRTLIVEDAPTALRLAKENDFDLVILDIDMPGMNGFEACTALKALPGYKAVPVIFVTGMSDFGARARSILSGGNDLIGKPFLFGELAMKVQTTLLKNLCRPQRPV